MKIAEVGTYDIRFPTSRELDGSDAMNPDPDYSAAYVVLRTEDGAEGHGFTFTIGRGNEVVRAALDALAPFVTGHTVDDLGEFARRLTHDSQIRWLGPEKGVMHLAAGAMINAAWDLHARRAGKPLWQLLSEMSPESLVELVDWRYLSDALTPAEAVDILASAQAGRTQRAKTLEEHGYPAYTTSAGWLGYSDEKIDRLARQAVADGFRLIKLKVGADRADDVRRLALARAAVGPDVRIAVDANQRWDVPEAIAWMGELAAYHPWWIEEPTSPDDILGHATIRRALAGSGIRVATGEHVANRVVFKQLLQADAIDVVQLDACRVAGVNENIAILLLAAKFGKPVCPHAGGVGLCEAVQHLSYFDYIAVSGRLDDRVIEYVDHLHEHFTDPVVVERGAYRLPSAPGFSTRIKPESLVRYSYPEGAAWN
ncbi:enolase C-terminal domain-like protein [Actinoplanes aureus]|nr:enolase C-terminal domain-like protein [Actinoplanes aureus]